MKAIDEKQKPEEPEEVAKEKQQDKSEKSSVDKTPVRNKSRVHFEVPEDSSSDEELITEPARQIPSVGIDVFPSGDINEVEAPATQQENSETMDVPISHQSASSRKTIPVVSISESELEQDSQVEENTEPHEEVSTSEQDDQYGTETLQHSDVQPSKNTVIQYCLKDNSITKAKVLSTQPKKLGKWKDWVNVQVVGQNEPSSVNWKDIIWWREAGKAENVLVLSELDQYNQDIVDAKEKEFQNLLEHDVFESVNDEGQTTISTKWIFHDKIDDDGSKWVKGRLVARGFEERLVDKKIDSPTCSRQGLRLEFITASSMDWEIKSMDISAAFLQGNQLKRAVYVQPPADLREDGKIWKLKRCLYGLNDAPREWYDRVCSEMKNLGGIVSLYDKSVFIWHGKSGLEGLITIHVDDFEYCGTSQWHKDVINKICDMFKISKQQTGSFKYVGLNIEQNGEEIFVDQQTYIDGLSEMQIDSERRKQLDEKLTTEEKKELRSVCGQLLWATSQTRPDAAFQSCQVSNHGPEATVRNLIEANKAIKKLKNESMKLNFPNLGDPSKMKVVAYGDGSHASLPSGASQGANIVFLTGNGRAAPVTWKSKKLDRVTKSPLASEIMAVADAADSGFLVASITQELFGLKKLPIIELRTDSKSLKEHLDSKKVIQDPRLRVDTARLREMTEIGEVELNWVSTKLMLADCLTKKDASSELLREVLISGKLPEDL